MKHAFDLPLSGAPAADAPVSVDFRGLRDRHGRALVLFDGCRPPVVPPDLRGLGWGDAGEGSLALSWLLLAAASGDTRLADDWHADFCAEVTARLPARGFVLRRDEIVAWLDSSPPAVAVAGDAA